MPVTTRSKSRLSVAPSQIADLTKTVKLPKTSETRRTKKPPKDRKYPDRKIILDEPSQENQVAAPKEHHKSETSPIISTKPVEGSYAPQDPPETKQTQKPAGISTPPAPPGIVMVPWHCVSCSCSNGIFEDLINICSLCGHEIDDHREEQSDPWNSGCDFVCEREGLIESVLQRARDTRVVVIRATPQVGKTTLLRLLGRYILRHTSDLDPVFVLWNAREQRGGLGVPEYLERERLAWEEKNARHYGPRAPRARPVFLIDEAQESYAELELWADILKNKNTRSQPLFVLVCLYGAADSARFHEPSTQSLALSVDSLQRVELRPSAMGQLHMLFKPEETALLVNRWAISNSFRYANGVQEYLHRATDGHPGMLGLILRYFELLFDQLPKVVRDTRMWTTSLCHGILVDDTTLLQWICDHGRGVWAPSSEEYVRNCLLWHGYSHLKFSDIIDTLREVAIRPHGVEHVQQSFDAFAFCHRIGYLHTEQTLSGGTSKRYLFASPIHQRVAYRRLFAGPEPGTILESTSLQQHCINAIARFSPSTLENRSRSSSGDWSIPEAAFQDEIYCCLNAELRNPPILSEYSQTTRRGDGRIDFFIFDQKWGIEVLRCRSISDIKEHAARFRKGGKYWEWNILKDYAILNFCSSKDTLEKIGVAGLDDETQSHLLHVVIDTAEYSADVFSCHKELLASLTIGEGRDRHYPKRFGSLSSSASSGFMTMQDQPTQREQAIMQKIEEMNLELQELRSKKRGNDREGIAKEQDGSALRDGRKRKR